MEIVCGNKKSPPYVIMQELGKNKLSCCNLIYLLMNQICIEYLLLDFRIIANKLETLFIIEYVSI